MESVKVREGRSEILVYLDKHFPDNVSAMREAAKAIQREIIRHESGAIRDLNRQFDSDVL